ncbi:hypothetical protein BDF14DRAFT_1999785 [Spinellus fusiger]|nr:hypothetical protein BDF14DRAFT_1999785 [Spinellus fusiger]
MEYWEDGVEADELVVNALEEVEETVEADSIAGYLYTLFPIVLLSAALTSASITSSTSTLLTMASITTSPLLTMINVLRFDE